MFVLSDAKVGSVLAFLKLLKLSIEMIYRNLISAFSNEDILKLLKLSIEMIYRNVISAFSNEDILWSE
jgi:hypothetical protein